MSRNILAFQYFGFMATVVLALLLQNGVWAAEDASTEKDRFRLLRQIYQQRLVLLAQREQAKQRLQPLVTDLNIAQAAYQGLAARAVNARVRAANLEAQANSLQNQWPMDSAERAQINVAMESIRAQYDLCQRECAEIEARGVAAATVVAGLRGQVNTVQGEISRLYAEANQLRAEWLALTDPFGKLSRGENERAVTIFSEWIVLSTSDPCAYWARGMAYLNTGKYVLAINDFDKVSQLEPQLAPMVTAVRGLAICRSGDEKRGMLDISKAIGMDKTNGLPYLWRGILYQEQKKYSQAINDFKSAMRLMPGNACPQESMALLLASCPRDSLRNAKHALEYATAANKASKGKDWTCLRTLAAAYAENRDYASAIKCVQLAVTVAPEEANDELQGQNALYEQELPYRLP